jgi:hypothetical protein
MAILDRLTQKWKKVVKHGKTQPKSPSNHSESHRSEGTNAVLNLQLHSDTEAPGWSSGDSLPKNQDVTRVADTSSETEHQSSHSFGERDEQCPSVLIIGTLWRRAAETLDKKDKEKLERLKSRQECERVNPSKENEEDLFSEEHSDSPPPVEVIVVQSSLTRLKEKNEEKPWRPVG